MLPPHHFVPDPLQTTVQYQPPWLDHPSSSFQYRSQPHTPYHHHCIHCTSQSHPHTPSSIRTTTAPRPKHPMKPPMTSPNLRNNEIRWPIDTTMNSSPM